MSLIAAIRRFYTQEIATPPADAVCARCGRPADEHTMQRGWMESQYRVCKTGTDFIWAYPITGRDQH
jgi:hypothetical protein